MNVRATTHIALVLLALSACSGRGTNALPAASLPQTSKITVPSSAAGRQPAFFMMPTPDYYDAGFTPSVTFVKTGTLVEEHTSSDGYLWYHVGSIDRASVSWGEAQQYDDGTDPAVSGNGSGGVFEVHRGGSNSDQLYYRTGTQKSIKQIDWNKVNGNTSTTYAKGYNPGVAFAGPNVVVETHTNGSGAGSWSVATIAGGTVTWHPGGDFFQGYGPSIAANAHGVVFEVERENSATHRGGYYYYPLIYRVGHVNATAGSVTWALPHPIDAAETQEVGKFSTVAIDDAGNVILLYVCTAVTYYAGTTQAFGWCTMTGKVGSDDTVHWVGTPLLAPPQNYFFELSGLSSPSVAVGYDAKLGADMAVGVAQQDHKGLYFASTLLTNRADWMGDRLDTTLKGKTLRQTVFPGSHDAGMYQGNHGMFGIAQSQNFYDQLDGGQRYFDIRPDANLNAWHGPGQGKSGYVTGASIESILDDVKKYMQFGHREVVILKFSHFTYNFWDSDKTYYKLKTMIADKLGPWLYSNDAVRAGTVRLADIPLATMIPKDHGIVLPVVDLPSNLTGTGHAGIYSYRDWDSTIDHNMQLTVYDQYAESTYLSTMQDDQLDKFYNFNGKMEHFPTVQCDLFLLSWTLTPVIAIRASAAEADAALGPVMSHARSNTKGFVPNVLFVDYYSWADPATVAIALNAGI